MTYQELMEQLDELCRTYHAFVIAIDGMAQAGKTLLADHLAEQYGAVVIRTEDFLLPQKERPMGWEERPGEEMDFDRFGEEIVTPFLEKRPIVYTRVHPVTGEPLARLALPEGQMYVVEGLYATHPLIPDFYDLRIFCEVDKETQRQRLSEGGHSPVTGEGLERQRVYFETYMTKELSDIVLNETFSLPKAEESENGENRG